MSNEVIEIVNKLCEKLGVAADILVPEMARYYIARLVFLVLAETIFVIVLATVSARITKWTLSETDADWYDWSDKAIRIFLVNMVPVIFLLFLLVSAISNASDLVGWIASPTASAVREIARLIK
jgi:hypothetical protein